MAIIKADPSDPLVDRLPPKGATASPTPAANPAGAGVANPAGAGSASTADSYIAGLSSGAGAAANGTFSDPTDPPLLWQKRTPSKGAGSASAADNGFAQSGDVMKRSDAEAKIFSSDGYREQVARQMIEAGLLDPTQINDLGAIQSAWNKVVGQSAAFYNAGNPRTPEEVIALINIQKNHAAAFPRTVTSDSTHAQDFGTDGPTQIRTALMQTLGRAPTASEMTTYQAGLNAAAQANPVQSHSTTTQDANGNSVTNTTNSGGIDPTEVLGQMAVTDPDYGAYQASTTYMNALKQAIGAFV